jgi:hypothetical protein
MGATEEAGKVATGAIDALKGNPGLLALIIMQAMTIGVVYFNASKLNERRHEREMLMLNKCIAGSHEKTSIGFTTLPKELEARK